MNRTELDQILETSKKNGTRANLRNANLQGADLLGADLRGANLRGADLEGADLEGADLRGANLVGADLEGADLEGADLRGANLQGADLEGANLQGADLEGANLRNADLGGAYLRGATYGEGVLLTKVPLQISGLRWPVLVLDEHVKIGCKLYTTEEWENFTDSKINAMDSAALGFWKKYKQLVLAAAKVHQAKPDER